MTAFTYRAVDTAGKEITGVLEADTARSARNALRERGLIPLDVGNATQGAAAKRIKHISGNDLSLLTRQWATLLLSALTAEQALAALIDQTDSEAVALTLTGVRSEVVAGYSLKAALDRFPNSFPSIYRASIAAGEKTGQLPQIMLQLADYLERRDALRRKILQALIYPVLVAIVAMFVITGLMVYVVPQVLSVFQHGKQSLPWLTLGLMALSSFLHSYSWILLVLIVGGLFGGQQALRREHLRRRWHVWLLGLPLLGRHLRAIETTRFASTLSILAGSGVPLLAALEAGRQVLITLPLREAVADAAERVKEGMPLSRALARTEAFPPVLIHLIASGEATGKLAPMLERAASLQQTELENRTAVITALLEPMLLLGMGGFVLLIVLAVMQPIIEMNQLFK